MIIPWRDNIINFVCFAAVEVDMMIGFADKFALYGGLKFISGQSQEINFILCGINFILSYFLNVLLNEISLISPISCPLDIIIIERLDLCIVPFINKPSSFGTSSCCLMAGTL